MAKDPVLGFRKLSKNGSEVFVVLQPTGARWGLSPFWLPYWGLSVSVAGNFRCGCVCIWHWGVRSALSRSGVAGVDKTAVVFVIGIAIRLSVVMEKGAHVPDCHAARLPASILVHTAVSVPDEAEPVEGQRQRNGVYTHDGTYAGT